MVQRNGCRNESETEPGQGPRLASLDALRAGSMLLVLIVHASISYTTLGVPNLLWGVVDERRSYAFDLIFWATLGLSMPIFFSMSGLLAAQVFDSRGALAFASSRIRRLVLPMLASVVLILPLCLYSWSYGWLISGRCNFREITRLKFHAPGLQENLYGPAHLWFLLYLLAFLTTYGLTRVLAESVLKARPRTLGSWLSTLFTPLLVCIPTVATLWIGHRATGTDPIMNMRNTFVPDPYRLAHHAWFFLVGVGMHRSRPCWENWARLAPKWLVIALISFAVRSAWLTRDLATPGGLTGLDRWVLTISGAIFVWTGTFGLLGGCLRWLNKPSASVRYIAQSSYWVYLIHFPLVGLIQGNLAPLKVPAGLKFSIVLSLTFLLCLSTYQTLVRHTWLGLWLHGPIHPNPPANSLELRGPHRSLSQAVHQETAHNESRADV